MSRVCGLSSRLGAGVSAFALVGSLVLTGCSGNPLEAAGNLLNGGSDTQQATTSETAQAIPDENLVQAGTLTVGLQTGFVGAPFIITGNNESIEGIDIDLASAIASDLGLDVRFVNVSGAESALGAHLCDIVMDVSADRAGTSTLLGGYYETATSFFHKGDETVSEVGALGGHSVGVQAGSVSEGVLNGTTLDMVRKPYTNLNEAFEALGKGEVDYVLCDAYPGAYLASAYPGVAFAGALNQPTSVGIAARLDNPAVQEAVQRSLEKVQTNGVYDIVRGRWVGGLSTVSADRVIQNVGVNEHATQGGSAESIEGGSPQNGTTAGANAVTVPNEEPAQQ